MSMSCGVVPRIWPNFLVERMSCVRCCGVRVLVVGGGTGKTILVEKAMADSGGPGADNIQGGRGWSLDR